MGKLEGRVAIVTGAGRGIGRGIAGRLAQEGAKVVVASRSKGTVDQVVEEINAAGGIATGVAVDVGTRDEVDRMVAEAVEAFGKVDILVNNAQSWGAPGSNAPTPSMVPIETYPEDEWDYIFQTGVKASLYGMQAVYPGMKERGWGRVVNLGSPAAQRGMSFLVGYNANKEAIRALSRTAALEWAKSGVTVNVVSPAIMTEAMEANYARRAAGDEEAGKKMLEEMMSQLPMGRLGSPADAGALVAFICSDDASYITGMTFMLDGGFLPG